LIAGKGNEQNRSRFKFGSHRNLEAPENKGSSDHVCIDDDSLRKGSRANRIVELLSSNTVLVKANLGNEIRMIEFSCESSLSQLKKRLAEEYGNTVDSIKFFDKENDKVTIDSEESM